VENYSTCINTNLNTILSPESSEYYDPLYSSRTNPNSIFTFNGDKSTLQQQKVPKLDLDQIFQKRKFETFNLKKHIKKSTPEIVSNLEDYVTNRRLTNCPQDLLYSVPGMTTIRKCDAMDKMTFDQVSKNKKKYMETYYQPDSITRGIEDCPKQCKKLCVIF